MLHFRANRTIYHKILPIRMYKMYLFVDEYLFGKESVSREDRPEVLVRRHHLDEQVMRPLLRLARASSRHVARVAEPLARRRRADL